MNIQLFQQALSFDLQYKILVDKKVNYQCEGYSNIFISEYLIKDNQERPIVSIFKCWLSVLSCYNIHIKKKDGTTSKHPIKFKSTGRFKNEFSFVFENNLFQIYAHQKLNYSIFKNGKQIARIKEDRLTSFKEDVLIMEVDNDENINLMISSLIILDLIYERKELSFLFGLIKINIGVLIEAKPFNENWQPNNQQI
jgi:uncharacterized protein YxjI